MDRHDPSPQRRGTTPAQRNEIGNAIINMHASGGKPSLNFPSQFRMKRCARRSAPTVDGSMGHLLDAEHDGLSLSEFTVFELRSC
jgi:type IV secretion system protein VirB4